VARAAQLELVAVRVVVGVQKVLLLVQRSARGAYRSFKFLQGLRGRGDTAPSAVVFGWLFTVAD